VLGEENDLGNDLDRLKEKAYLLDAIEEEDIPDIELEEMDEDEIPKRGGAATTSNIIKESSALSPLKMVDKDGSGSHHDSGIIEPEQNLSQMFTQGDKNMNELIAALNSQEWLQEELIKLPTEPNSKLIDFFFLQDKMLCIFEDFQVQEIDLQSKCISKSYNLQEIEGFEISEEVEEDKVVAFSLEKDLQIVGVACKCNVHVFGYDENNDVSLEYIANVPKSDITQLVFVETFLVMLQNEGTNLTVSCFNFEEEKTSESLVIEG
jgi:hypothetical protein